MSGKYNALRRVDVNQAAIVRALRESGASVAVLSSVGRGLPDLLVGFQGVNFLLEVKNLEGRGARLTPAERDFFETWRGCAVVVVSVEEALRLVGVCDE